MATLGRHYYWRKLETDGKSQVLVFQFGFSLDEVILVSKSRIGRCNNTCYKAYKSSCIYFDNLSNSSRCWKNLLRAIGEVQPTVGLVNYFPLLNIVFSYFQIFAASHSTPSRRSYWSFIHISLGKPLNRRTAKRWFLILWLCMYFFAKVQLMCYSEEAKNLDKVQSKVRTIPGRTTEKVQFMA